MSLPILLKKLSYLYIYKNSGEGRGEMRICWLNLESNTYAQVRKHYEASNSHLIESDGSDEPLIRSAYTI